MKNENSRTTIVFMVCALVILVFYQVFVMGPATKRQQAAAREAAAAHAVQHPAGLPAAPVFAPVAQAAAASPRVKLDTPSLTGSINLRGGRIDDLYLKHYRETID